MLIGIALIYVLLCVGLRIQLEAGFADGQGSAALCVSAFGISLRRDFVFEAGVNGFAAVPRYGKGKKQKNRTSGYMGHFMKAYAIKSLRSGQFDSLMLHVRLGLGDACATALASGTAHALVCSLLAPLSDLRSCNLRMTPDFDQVCLCVHARGIFSCSAGDIMLALLKAAPRKRKEGFKWTSIPLRA